MECLDGVWEPIEGNTKAQFTGNIHFTLSLLEHTEAPVKVFKTRIKQIQPTAFRYERVDLAPFIETFEETFEEEDQIEAEEPVAPIVEPAPQAALRLGVGWTIESEDSSGEWMNKIVPHYP